MRVGLQDRATADAVGLGFKSRWRTNAIAQAKQSADLVAHLLRLMAQQANAEGITVNNSWVAGSSPVSAASMAE